MKEKALSIYNAHLAIILHHFPDAPKYQQHTAAKKAAVREVEQILKSNPIVPMQFMTESEALDAAYTHWRSVLTELHKL